MKIFHCPFHAELRYLYIISDTILRFQTTRTRVSLTRTRGNYFYSVGGLRIFKSKFNPAMGAQRNLKSAFSNSIRQKCRQSGLEHDTLGKSWCTDFIRPHQESSPNRLFERCRFQTCLHSTGADFMIQRENIITFSCLQLSQKKSPLNEATKLSCLLVSLIRCN